MDLSDFIPGADGADLKKVLDLVLSNKDVLEKIDQLPALFRSLSDDLEKAGGEAKSAAVALVGEDGQSGARSTLGTAASALRSISGNVDKGANLIKDAGEMAGKVPLMDGPAAKLKDTGDNLGATTGNFEDLAKALEATADVLAKVATALEGVGSRLQDSSSTVHGFVGA